MGDLDLMLVTESYPFDGAREQTFLEPELAILRDKFERIILVPQRLDGVRLPVPDNAIVRTDYAEGIATLRSRLRHPGFPDTLGLLLEEISARPAAVLHPRGGVRLARFLLRAAAMDRWIRRYIGENPARVNRTVLYTWWADATTMGFGMAKRRLRSCVVVSRAHSTDLYPERLAPAYLPCRDAMYRTLDRLYPDSELGAQYVRRKYPWFASRCIPARQGTADPGFRTTASADGAFRVVSCSFLIPRKRISLLVGALGWAAKHRPAVRFEWTHIGDGPLRGAVELQLGEVALANLSGRIMGMLEPDQMFDFYRTQPIDLFANVSDNEGTPVSLMEAASCGMPILATSVGGNIEVVTDGVGALLGEDPDVPEIGKAIVRLVDDPDLRRRLRLGARKRWESSYNASTNYARFADELVALRASAGIEAPNS